MARIEFHKNRVLAQVESITDVWSEKYANRIKASAIARLKSSVSSKTVYPRGRRPGQLAREINVETSKFKGGGHFVQAQGPGKWTEPYHASFVELGLKRKDMDAIPFMRPALIKHKRRARRALEVNLI